MPLKNPFLLLSGVPEVNIKSTMVAKSYQFGLALRVSQKKLGKLCYNNTIMLTSGTPLTNDGLFYL